MSNRAPMPQLVADLSAEHRALDAVLSELPAVDWDRPSPSPGWTVADQVGHLAYFDRTATLAIVDRDGFADHLVAALAEMQVDDLDGSSLRQSRAMAPEALHERWRAGAAGLVNAAVRLGADDRLPWYGPPMGARSFLTARLMETWAHGHDLTDTFGLAAVTSTRLRHIAQLGFITRSWSYAVRRREMPDVPIRVELLGPGGDRWSWGDEGASQSIQGPALGFCEVVTQRRHVDDTDLIVAGDAAAEWMDLAQAFAGAPTSGPEPRSSDDR